MGANQENHKVEDEEEEDEEEEEEEEGRLDSQDIAASANEAQLMNNFVAR